MLPDIPVCFAVQSPYPQLGLLLAIGTYVTIELNFQHSNAIQWMHLVSSIEGRPMPDELIWHLRRQQSGEGIR
jgi:hypothetical protein